MSAVATLLKDALVARVTTLGLTIGGAVATVTAQKLPMIRAGVDSPPLIRIAGGQRAGENRMWTTEARKRVVYDFEVSLLCAGNREPNADEDDYDTAQQAIGRVIEPPTVLGVAGVYDIEVNPGVTYERGSFPKNYDFSRIGLRITVDEPAHD